MGHNNGHRVADGQTETTGCEDDEVGRKSGSERTQQVPATSDQDDALPTESRNVLRLVTRFEWEQEQRTSLRGKDSLKLGGQK